MKVLDVLCVLGSAKHTIDPLAPLRFTSAKRVKSTISIINSAKLSDLQYKTKSDSEFQDWDGSEIELNYGEYLEVRAKYNIYSGNVRFNISGDVALSGNIQSLVHGEDLNKDNQTKINCYLDDLFSECDITDASQLLLPAEDLGSETYMGLFRNCKKLRTAPKVLPPSSLLIDCCQSMFSGCTSLITAPEILATSLYNDCCFNMFKDCTNLKTIKVHFTEWPSADISTFNWLQGVSPTGTFICPKELPEQRGDSYIPDEWTIERF